MKITRNEFLGFVGAAAAAITLTGARAGADVAERPNFLVILTDDQAFRAIGYNRGAVKTPNLDRLAGEGIVYDHAYIATPICAASRASLLTGVFPQQHGSVGLDSSGFRANAVESQTYPTLARRLTEAGYITALCGKSHLGDPTGYGFAHGEEIKRADDTDTFAYARDFLERHRAGEAPFLLWLATHQPHIALNAPPEYIAMYEHEDLDLDPNFMESPPDGSIYNQGLPGERYYRDSGVRNAFREADSGPPRTAEQMKDFLRIYYAVISHLDAQIGTLLDTLHETGLHERTVLVFLSDNGYLLGNHGLGNKITMHEESVRVPMFIHAPALGVKAARSPSLVSSLDVYPTLLDLAGIAQPGYLMGRSLVPTFTNPATTLREYAASECVGVGGKPGMGHRMVRTKDWKYVLTDTNDEWLFDEVDDPYELTNLAGSDTHHEHLVQMRAYMQDWMTKVGDTHAPPAGERL